MEPALAGGALAAPTPSTPTKAMKQHAPRCLPAHAGVAGPAHPGDGALPQALLHGAEEPGLTDAKGSHGDKSELAMVVTAAADVNTAEEPGASSVVADRQLACTLVSDMISARKLEFDGSKLNADNDSALDLMQQIKMNICNVDAPLNSLPDSLSQVSSAAALVPASRSFA